MERLNHSKPRDYKEVEESLQNSIKFDWEGKVKRLQQLGQIIDWKLNEAIRYWLTEAENCYIMGSYFAASFFAGATLELAMKLHALSWKPPKKIKEFDMLIKEFHKKGIIDQKEEEMARELKNIRNCYAHAKINELAEIAVKNGLKVKSVPSMITSTGIEKIPDADEKIIKNPEDFDMKLVFLSFNRENIAWKAIKNVHTLLLKLYPYKY